MKKSAILVLAMVVIVTWSCPAAAVEGLNWGVGLKGWYNDMNVNFGPGTEGTSKDPVFMVGPNVKMSYKGFFAGASYLFTTSDYKFDFGFGLEMTADRKDFDILAGYMFIPNVGAFLGYKYIDIGLDAPIIPISATDKYHLGAVGLTGNYSLPTIPLTFYANAAYLRGKWKETTSRGFSGDSDANGFSIEGGASYRIWQGLSAGLGYKYQELKVEDDKPTVTGFKQKFKGFTVSADYNF